VSATLEPRFDHLLAISGPLGTYEHADGAVPRLEHGMCADDIARVVVVLARERELSAPLEALAAASHRFLAQAVEGDGRCSNRCSSAGVWRRDPTVEDCWGRTVRAAGVVFARSRTDAEAEWANRLFARLARQRSPHLRATAHAALGAAEVLAADLDHQAARALLVDAATVLDRPEVSDAWRWIEPRLAYANATLADGLVAAGAVLGDDALVASGLRKLAWLVAAETRHGHFSVTPVGGRGPGDLRPGFDQQPLEVAALAEACLRAHRVTGESSWLAGVDQAVQWFFGANDLGVVMIDAATGGGFDGLMAGGVNRNEGAESTIAVLETLQYARECVAMYR
jgi:hypothetical protein